jgi:hypothetical protein
MPQLGLSLSTTTSSLISSASLPQTTFLNIAPFEAQLVIDEETGQSLSPNVFSVSGVTPSIFNMTYRPSQNIFRKLVGSAFVDDTIQGPKYGVQAFFGAPTKMGGIWTIMTGFNGDEGSYYKYYAHAPSSNSSETLFPLNNWVSSAQGLAIAEGGIEGESIIDSSINPNFTITFTL